MKSQFMCALVLTLAAVLVSGCGGHLAKEEIGAVVGAGLGGLAGSFIGDGGGQLVAVGVGTLLGAIMGSEVGKSLDRADRLALAQAQQDALEHGKSGVKTTWKNPDSANSGEVVPQPAYRQENGTICREFMQVVMVGDEVESVYGVACREPSGTWKLS